MKKLNGIWATIYFKGFAIGSANVIPGVSGGTIALLTGIFERLINDIKSLNIQNLTLLLRGRFRDFAAATDLSFLAVLAAGILTAVITLARVFEFLFVNYPVYIWSYFFGLILASVYFVGIKVERRRVHEGVALLLGIAVALAISVMKPLAQNTGTLYLILCGIAGICSMILPGLSGSFVLIILGNYHLIMIEAVNHLRLDVLIPVAVGAVAGLLLFARLLSWLLARYNSQTIAVLSGFIFGSLGILWPWKSALYLKNAAGELILKGGEKVVTSYVWQWPDMGSGQTWLAFLIMLIGVVTIAALERSSRNEAPNA